MKQITVAHSIIPYLFQTGNWIYNQIKFSEKIRHIVLTTNTENINQFPFESVYSINSLPRVRQLLEKGYNKILKKRYYYWKKVCKNEQVNILHSHFGTAGLRNIKFAESLNIPHVVSFYGSDMSKNLYYNPELKNSYKIMFKHIDAIFVEGEYAKNTIIKLGFPENKIYISHLGVDIESIQAVQRVWNENESFKILIVGTFTKKKGIIISLKAIDQVIKNNPNIKIGISLVGEAQQTRESQKTKKEILQFIENSSLNSVVKFHGYIPYKKVLEMSYDFHLLMQTSIFGDDGDSEGGFPVIITDLMATGLPVLGSNHCDIPEIIKDKKNGFIVPENDISETTNKIKLIIENFNALSETWFCYNEKFLDKQFDAKICALKREKLYDKIIKNNQL